MRQLPFFSLIVPFWLIWVFAGFRGMKEVWPAVLVTGVSFALPQFLISNFVNPWIVDIGTSCALRDTGFAERNQAKPHGADALAALALRLMGAMRSLRSLIAPYAPSCAAS